MDSKDSLDDRKSFFSARQLRPNLPEVSSAPARLAPASLSKSNKRASGQCGFSGSRRYPRRGVAMTTEREVIGDATGTRLFDFAFFLVTTLSTLSARASGQVQRWTHGSSDVEKVSSTSEAAEATEIAETEEILPPIQNRGFPRIRGKPSSLLDHRSGLHLLRDLMIASSVQDTWRRLHLNDFSG
ncbi:hypothetical protein PoB_001805100 [Plakobranchus ocellatus]|uniref:Uncharacterized protein n=1 Tax=Plakobranchus ocellatus TaxID=259542 RepID=A0AAV3Z6M2_9GAST|nr:hypothetical protein PoB_001805100 [Plakobranchus ocellatus]